MARSALGSDDSLTITNLNGEDIMLVPGATYMMIPYQPQDIAQMELAGAELDDRTDPYSCFDGGQVYWTREVTMVRLERVPDADESNAKCTALTGVEEVTELHGADFLTQWVGPFHLGYAVRPPKFEDAAEAQRWLDAHDH